MVRDSFQEGLTSGTGFWLPHEVVGKSGGGERGLGGQGVHACDRWVGITVGGESGEARSLGGCQGHSKK